MVMSNLFLVQCVFAAFMTGALVAWVVTLA